MFTIEKNVPITTMLRGYRENQFPLDHMEVGDSFLITGDEDFVTRKGKTVRSSVAYYSRRTGRKFLTRKVTDGVRVWRTE